ncbi:MAG: murein biosynthesis integral membrane protein MurJ [Rickettsiales bacterium]|jgi:putative peptidoglycan lipid II flippase|nr:murein biosynthesis integral membrane protein MurJ [Rickettsiales bacterium]
MEIFKNTAVIGVCTILSRVSGFLRDLFFAKYLGAGLSSEAFLVALRIPNFFRNFLAEGVFYSSFVPLLSGELAKNGETDRDFVKRFSQNIFSLALYFLLIFTIALEMAMPIVVKAIAPAFSGDFQKYSLTVKLSRITFPFLIIISMSNILTGVLNCFGKFVAGSLTPIIINLSFIFFSIVAAAFNKSVAFALSYALLIGGTIEFICLFYFTAKSGTLIYPKTVTFDALTKNFLKLFLNGAIAISFTQLSGLINSITASYFLGAIAYIYYADRLIQLPIALIGTAISRSALPVLSKKTTLRSEDRFDLEENILFYALFFSAPCAIGLFLLAPSAVPFLFQGGMFLERDSAEVIRCVKILSLATPNYILIKIFDTIFFANGDTATPVFSSMVSLASNIIFNYALTRYFGYGGILISTLISASLNVSFLIFFIWKKKYMRLSRKFFINLLKLIYPILFMILILTMGNKISGPNAGKLPLFLKLLLLGGLSGIVYLGLSLILGLINLNFFRKKYKKV